MSETNIIFAHLDVLERRHKLINKMIIIYEHPELDFCELVEPDFCELVESVERRHKLMNK